MAGWISTFQVFRIQGAKVGSARTLGEEVINSPVLMTPTSLLCEQKR